MGRSQRHKVYIQGYASDDKIRAEGMIAGLGSSTRDPPASLFPGPPGLKSPTVSGISPTTAVVNTGNKTITVTGTNFATGLTTVIFGVVDLATTFVSGTSVTAVVSSVQVPNTQQVGVRNGPYVSNTKPFTFTAT